MIRRDWVWGDKRMGYAVRKLARKSNPYRMEIWLKNKIVRHDDFETRAKAEEFARHRKRQHYGRMSAPQARKKYGTVLR